MFRLVCFVEDKKLVPVLKLLTGNVVNMEPPQAILSNGSGKHMTGVDVVSSMPKTFTVNELRAKLGEAGLSPGSYSAFLTSAKIKGIVANVSPGKWRKK